MSEQLPGRERDVPRVVLADRVIKRMVEGALLYPEPETGEALVGLIMPQAGWQEPDIYVLDTISPGEQAVREWGMFEQGSDWQADVFNWLHANWEAFRDLRRSSYGSALAAKWDVSLSHVGDWHKQPGDMTEPSSGDAQTAREMINDYETPMECLVAPIVTMYPAQSQLPDAPAEQLADHVKPEEIGAANDAVLISLGEMETDSPTSGAGMPEQAPVSSSVHPGTTPIQNVPPRALIETTADGKYIVRIDFWYMSSRTRRFIPISPIVWPDDRLPGLPPVAWHLAHPKRFEQEMGFLSEAGYMVSMARWDADGRPPYEICFSVYKMGQPHVILLITPVDYPTRQPAVRVAPLVNVADDEDVFEKLYTASKPLLATQMPQWDWDSKRTLIELVWHIGHTLEKGAEL